MKIKALKAGFAISALALSISPAMAVELRFDGFASFVAGQVLDEEELVRDANDEVIPFRGYSDRLDLDPNSLFALQVRADLADKLSATAQIVAKGSEGYQAKFNWAYMTYEVTDEFTVKVGRFRQALFMYSDFLDVGYAYHWIEPPKSVYDLSGVDSTTGFSLEYQTDIGPITTLISSQIGRTKQDLPDQGYLDSHNAWNLSVSLNWDWFTVRAIHSEADVTIYSDDFDTLAYALSTAYGLSDETLDSMLLNSDYSAFDGVGVSIDTGSFFAATEYTETRAKGNFSADPTKSWYFTTGVRFGDWVMYATAENRQSDIQQETLDNILAEFDANTGYMAGIAAPQLSGTIAALLSGAPVPGLTIADVPNLQFQYDLLSQALMGIAPTRDGILAMFNQSNVDQDTWSVGVRYNFHPSASIKFEYMEMDDKISELKPAAVAVAVDLVY